LVEFAWVGGEADGTPTYANIRVYLFHKDVRKDLGNTLYEAVVPNLELVLPFWCGYHIVF
jgi:hypothetical protein